MTSWRNSGHALRVLVHVRRERIVGNLQRAMFELRGAERGAQIDVPAAFADMLAFNGGAPLRCLA
jgi:cyclase